MKFKILKAQVLLLPILLMSCGKEDEVFIGDEITNIRTETVLKATKLNSSDIEKLKIQTSYDIDEEGYELKQKDKNHKIFYNADSKSLVIKSKEREFKMDRTFFNYIHVKELDLSSTSNDTSILSNMGTIDKASLSYMTNLEKVNMENFHFGDSHDISGLFNVTNKKLKEINIKGVETFTVHNASYLFANTLLETIDLDFSYAYLEDLSFMFKGCTNLKTVTFRNDPLARFLNIEGMFEGTQITTVNNINTTETINMKGLFKNANIINAPTIKLNLKNVEDMSYMFYGCATLDNLNNIVFDKESTKLTNIESMFEGCSSLKKVDLSSLNLEKVINASKLFKENLVLENIKITGNLTSVKTLKEAFYNTSKNALAVTLDMIYLKSVLAKEQKADKTINEYILIGDNYFTKGSVSTNSTLMIEGAKKEIVDYLVLLE